MTNITISIQSNSENRNIVIPVHETKVAECLNVISSHIHSLKNTLQIENYQTSKEQLLVEDKIDYNTPRPAPLGNLKSNGLGDPFKGTSWGINN